jgi:hypothetical protein
MAFDYPALRDNTVEPKIAEYGKPGTLYVNDPATGDPWDSQLGAETAHAVTVLQTAFTKSDNKGTLVEMGDVMFLVSTEGVTTDPELAHRIEVNSITYQVVRIDPLFPGPTIMFWKVHARK